MLHYYCFRNRLIQTIKQILFQLLKKNLNVIMFKRLVINYNNKFICFILTFPTLTGSSKENNKEESRQEGGDNPADG